MEQYTTSFLWRLHTGCEVAIAWPDAEKTRALKNKTLYMEAINNSGRLVKVTTVLEPTDGQEVFSEWVPIPFCKLLLRSIDDMTEQEDLQLQQMGFSLSYPKRIVMDESHEHKHFRISEISGLVLQLIQWHFHVGILPSKYCEIKQKNKK